MGRAPHGRPGRYSFHPDAARPPAFPARIAPGIHTRAKRSNRTLRRARRPPACLARGAERLWPSPLLPRPAPARSLGVGSAGGLSRPPGAARPPPARIPAPGSTDPPDLAKRARPAGLFTTARPQHRRQRSLARLRRSSHPFFRHGGRVRRTPVFAASSDVWQLSDDRDPGHQVCAPAPWTAWSRAACVPAPILLQRHGINGGPDRLALRGVR